MLLILFLVSVILAVELDCNGIPCDTVDACGVCNGNSTCLDCNNVPNGSSVLDLCGVCNGLNACIDCHPRDRDSCGVCFGNFQCFDCAFVQFGTSRYDLCDVCNGDSTSCVDCAGFVFGTSVYDVCDVCNGDGQSCLGCDGMPNSGAVVDRCGKCGGSNDCLDCNGVPDGLGSYDSCDVCDGDDTSCIDCAGVRNGQSRLNRCGRCTDSLIEDETCTEESVGDQRTQQILFYVFLGLSMGCCACCLCTWAVARRRKCTSRALLFALLTTSRAQFVSPGEEMAGRLCFRTNLGTIRPYMCEPYFDVCKDTNANPLFLCENSQISHVQFNNVPNIEGRISPAEFTLMQNARVITIQSNKPLSLVIASTAVFDQLEVLRISNVRLLSPLDSFISTLRRSQKLRTLHLTDISSNSGRFGQTSALCTLPALRSMTIRDTNITGAIGCDGISPRWELLETMDLRGNNLTDLFQSLQRFPIRTVLLQNNRLSGTIPAGDVFPERIVDLSLSSNKLSGFLGSGWGALNRLSRLVISNNGLTGTLPNLPQASLVFLDFSFNRLIGTIPAQLALPPLRRFSTFRADHNQLELPFPPFQVDSFLDECRFENNKICSPQEIPPDLVDVFRQRGCSFSVNSASLCAGGCGDRSCVGCDGVANSTVSVDACGVCGGRNFTCTDCSGTLFGTLQKDPCGVCGGDGGTCADCRGQPNGPAVIDVCGVCQGGGDSCRDCQGTPAGTAQVDACGVCNGRNYSCSDCNGNLNMSVRFDEFGVCGGSGVPPDPSTASMRLLAVSAIWMSILNTF
jgi:hypothetical protein